METTSERFDRYLDHLAQGLGRTNRHAGLRGYCTGLMLPLSRKSVEPMAARLDPLHVSARHQALHHFVAQAQWSDEELLRRVAQWVLPEMDCQAGGCWIIDDVGFPKKGMHSVGVARQWCGMLGKTDNCQVAVSVSLACEAGSLPMAFGLYLPEEWTSDWARCRRAGVPVDRRFATKPQLALEQLEELLAQGLPHHPVLADAAYGTEAAFRRRLTELGLPYMVGVKSNVGVWPSGAEPLAGRGRRGARPDAAARPVSVEAVAQSLPETAWHTLTWRQGSNEPLTSRFASVRVRPAGAAGRSRQLPEEWLLIEWPEGTLEPCNYWLSTLPEDAPLETLVACAHRRWRIERDYQELKQDFGLSHYEGRGWRGFHHHASLSIAAYGFLMAERLRARLPEAAEDVKKKFVERQAPALPQDHLPRGRPARPAACARLDPDAAAAAQP